MKDGKKLVVLAAIAAVLLITVGCTTAFADPPVPGDGGWGWMGGNGGMTGGYGGGATGGYGGGMTGGYGNGATGGFGGGMMGGYGNGATGGFGGGMMGSGFGGGMMGGSGGGMMGPAFGGPYGATAPLSVDAARAAVEAYLAGIGNADLKVAEVMVFSNHAYAEVVEKSTGTGALELLVDPVTLAVFPEFGPNMMWNTKYGHMAGFGGGMMGGGWLPQTTGPMTVTAEDAVKAAQSYLDANSPGAQAEATADRFYGYYTIHILKGGKTTGMLSVNGYTGRVFPHFWHGDFVAMSAD